jgi:hypothetical protein
MMAATEAHCEQNPASGHYTCTYRICGRPFLVGVESRQSDACATAAWRDATLASLPTLHRLAATPSLDVLDAATRAAIARHFTRAALLEHASIAAFARFSLELLALGAPPALVADATRAMADETRHALLCFELASRYAGRDIGPGPLDVNGALGALELPRVVERAVLEGCIGETAAALEATWAAETATEPVVRAVLWEIAADEERHAALAFRFVRWAVERDARLLERSRALLDAVQRAPAGIHAAAPAHTAELAAHGVSSPDQRRSARTSTLHDIIPAIFAALAAPAVNNEAEEPVAVV